MGADDGPHPEDGEGPVRHVTLGAFSLAAVTVTNAAFAAFVDETGYKTVAEREGYSFVFQMLLPGDAGPSQATQQAPWWRRIAGACWRWPEGPQGAPLTLRMDHPAVHVALGDALAYCHWSGTRLPTEAEWEYAARGGLVRQPFPWGNTLEQGGQRHCNVWQGTFPRTNTAADGHIGTAPATSYRQNGYGFYSMTGNVWEWTADRFTTQHSPRPTLDPTGPLNGSRFVAKGGSYLCHASYCLRYRTSSRQALNPQTTSGNLGFRVARYDPT